MDTRFEDLLYTLDLCAEALSFDLQAEHVYCIEEIRRILTEKRDARPPARILSFRGVAPNDRESAW